MSKFTTSAAGVSGIAFSTGFVSAATAPTSGQPVLGDITGLVGGITPRTNLTGALQPQNGGMGLTTYTVGDIPYASALNTMTQLPISAGNVCLLSGTTPSWGQPSLATTISGALPVTSGGTGFTAPLVGGCVIASSNNTISEVPLSDGQVMIGLTGGLPFAGTFEASTNVTVTSSSGAISVDTNIGASDKIPASFDGGDTSTGLVGGSIWYPLQHIILANALTVDGSMIEFFYTFNYTATSSATRPTYYFGGVAGPIANITVGVSAATASSGRGYLRVMLARTGAETASLRFELVYNNTVRLNRTSDENVGYNAGTGGWTADGNSVGIGFSVPGGLPATFTLASRRITYYV